VGQATAQAILDHRPLFRENLAKERLKPALRARWRKVRRPFTLVAVFGSWCGDSREFVPGLLALEADPNPFIEVHYLGVARDKQVADSLWPSGCPPQKVHKVPSFYLFSPQPGGAQKLVGLVVENPPRPKQTMAEALVEMIETALKLG
jgi:thiol-disulfide isomerase/thioredoxin